MAIPGGRWTSAEARAAAASIVRRLRDAGHVAYFAGGCVRDELLGFEPTDYDVATDARPDALRTMFRNTAAVGASFGVVLVKERGVTVEVATFRSDGPYTDRRRPDHVEFADAAADARRRDFTINALFIDPLEPPGPDGARVIDLVGGREDLRARVVRAVGDPEARLAEDHLRALRGVRFAARYGFEIDPATREAMTGHARALAGVSRERIGEEVRRMLAHPARARAVELLHALTLDAPVLDAPPTRRVGRALEGLPPGSSVRASLAAWALDLQPSGRVEGSGTPGLVRRWRRALCLSNAEGDGLRACLEGVRSLESGWLGKGVAARKREAAGEWFPDALAIVAARDRALAGEIRADVGRLAVQDGGLAPPALIDGTDLQRMGMSPGPAFARILREVYDAQLEGRVRTREEAEARAMELGGSGGV